MTKVQWKLVNAPQIVPNKDMIPYEYVCKYKGEVFMLINGHESNRKFIHLYIIKNYVRTYITTIFSYLTKDSAYVNKTVDFDGINIKFDQYGDSFFQPLPWVEIQEKAIKYIDEISND